MSGLSSSPWPLRTSDKSLALGDGIDKPVLVVLGEVLLHLLVDDLVLQDVDLLLVVGRHVGQLVLVLGYHSLKLIQLTMR